MFEFGAIVVASGAIMFLWDKYDRYRHKQRMLAREEMARLGIQYHQSDPRYGHDSAWIQTYNTALKALDEGRDPQEDLLKAKLQELEPKPKKTSSILNGAYIPQNPVEWDAAARAYQARMMQQQAMLQNMGNRLDQQHQLGMQQMDQSMQQQLGQLGNTLGGLGSLLGGIFGDGRKH